MDIIHRNQNEAPKPSEPKNDIPEKKPSKIRQFFHRHKKVLLIVGPIVLILVIVLVGWLCRKHPAVVTNINKTVTKAIVPTPKPVTVADPLTGLQVSQDSANQPVVGVMIENLYPDARPQSGLSVAGAVYEALAEGGITRFLAIFQEPLPTSIGPVRSLRPYYLRWGLEYNAPVAHAGGSEPALADIKPLGLKNIDALTSIGNYFFRTNDRAAPHNLYTNDKELSALVAKLGWATAPTFTPLARKADSPLAVATHTKIDIIFGSSEYNVEWQYDPTNNNYKRVQGGVAQNDRNTSAQITAKNVVVEYTPTSYGTQNDGKPKTDINLTGTGKALVFLDGNVVTATWSKESDAAQTKFVDQTGTLIKFNAGNTWYEIIPTGNTVTD